MPTIEQQLEECRRRLDTLEGQAKKTSGALQLAPHQQGPRPGWFRAARIEGTQMIIDLSASQAGTSPLITVTDTAGVRRVEMGFLAANGISPQQYGLRANNSVGSPIFDSLGLIAVMQLLGKSTFAGGNLVGTGSAQEVSDGQLNFTLTQDGMVLVFILANITLTSGGATSALIDLVFDHRSVGGGFYSFPAAIANVATTTQLPVLMIGLSAAPTSGGSPGALTAGTHSVNMRITSPNTVTAAWDVNGGMVAFTLGRTS